MSETKNINQPGVSAGTLRYAIGNSDQIHAPTPPEPSDLDRMDTDAREPLAAYAHEAWAGWMRYMFSKAEPNADGSWTMPAWAVERWQRQMQTPYAELPESEKASDREEADKMLAIVGQRVMIRTETAPPFAIDEDE